ncbi:hypothetical protein GCM10029992_04790 [Glycomyces albus]
MYDSPHEGERVAQPPPVPGVAQGPVADADALALEGVPGLDQALVGDRVEAVGGGDRLGRLLGPLEREAATWTTSRPASRSAAASAISRPNSDSP